MCWLLITVVILVRCSVVSLEPAPAWPVVVVVLLSAAPLDSAFMLPLRPSAFMPLVAEPFSFVSELMLFDFSPFIILLSWADFSPFGPAFMSSWARWFFALPGCIFSSDCVVFAAGAALSDASLRFIEGAARSEDGALC